MTAPENLSMLPKPWARQIPTTDVPWRWSICGPAVLLLYKNTVVRENQWIEFELEGNGSNHNGSNRSAIGAQVTLFWNGQQQVQEVSGGSGFAAQNDRRLHFGLGGNPDIEKAVVRWPSGKVQIIDQPAANQLHKVKEPA
jgi:hypothetical protein